MMWLAVAHLFLMFVWVKCFQIKIFAVQLESEALLVLSLQLDKQKHCKAASQSESITLAVQTTNWNLHTCTSWLKATK